MCKSEVKIAMPKIINGTAARTSFQDNRSYVTFLLSEWHIRKAQLGKSLRLISSLAAAYSILVRLLECCLEHLLPVGT